ncbi:TfuA-like protein [Sorangium sp. So ce327]|uniref:TfuA-like protein n=1 Tax=Sorangium sp. So ce327 TaxID=3133301 RepID=UPI003F6483A4
MIVLFTGPSLPPADVPAVPDLRVLPPAAQGDVYRAARERPWGIGLVDGFFEHVPAVWHKEILWAMAEGVHVFGASSMGALRAAELADFGMVGVGWVFEQFRAGALDADDEVALTHLAADHGYRHVSEALVDIRATLDAAVAAGACTRAAADRLVALAKQRFYPDRRWPELLAEARATGCDVAALERWLPGGRVDQKRRDALALVHAMQAARAAGAAPKRVDYAFERTDAWDHALPRMRAARGATAAPLLDALRALGDASLYASAVHGALARALAEDAAARQGLSVSADLIERTAQQFRREHGLYTAAETRAWLAEQELDPAAFLDLMRREAVLRCAQAATEPELDHHLADQLRAMSCYGRVRRSRGAE